ncbi:MAG: thrombospondin type 3 repeat-containing protein, partial [Robiginitalea sp.]|uniref:T9SS type A sorting domain-containing protein n=1 Tax=Robiginitalea sp. TaxID=1902411 RepID=UPI003C796C59
CPNSPVGATVNNDGCSSAQRDSDNDGVNDDRDICPNTPGGAAVDGNGCSSSQRDSDNDGVNDDRDTCSNTAPGASVDSNGCAASQRDSDNDGVTDDRDTCPNTPAGESVNASGCSAPQRDSDNDGVNDNLDTCPNTPANTEVDATGCPVNPNPDSDGDGVPDTDDVCPNTPASSEVDANGCPINSSIDQFSIQTTGLSCREANDGFFEITSAVSGTFEIIVTGLDSDYSVTRTFTENLTLDGLRPGGYELCISGTGISGSQCFIGIIDQPESLEVDATVNALQASLNLSLRGGETYTITLNGFAFTTTSTEVTLALENKVNTLEVTTDKLCQGIFETVIRTDRSATVSPNPFSQRFTLDIPGNSDQKYDISVYTVAGQLVSNTSVGGGRTLMELTSNPSGIYYLVIRSDGFEQVIKLVKK